MFFGRYYYNFADRLAGANPGGTNRRDYKFNDLNGNRLYDGVQELGALVASAGGSTTTVDPNLKTPYADEISVSYEQQFWGESSLRVAYVRKMTRDDFATYNVLREGQFTVPRNMPIAVPGLRSGPRARRARSWSTTFPIRCAARCATSSPASPTASAAATTTSTRSSSRSSSGCRAGCSCRAASTISGATSCGRRRTASNSPLDSDPLGINYFQNVFPDVSNRQESTNWQGRLMGRY